MTAHRDPDLLVRAFLKEGQTELADQVYDAVRATIDHRQQRVVIGPWRMPNIMNKLVPIGVGAAAVVVAVVVGAQLLGAPASGGVGGAPSASPSASPSATPSATPSSSPDPSAAAPTNSATAYLPEGPFQVQDTSAPSEAPRITVTIPAPGWTPLPEFGGLNKLPDTDPPQAMLLWAWPAGTTIVVYGDPCHWATAERKPTSTVDEVAAALAAQPSRDASDPVDVSVGEYAGKHITLHVPDDWDPVSNDCDQRSFASYGVSGGEPSRTHQGPGQVDELWILDVDGAIAIIDAMYRPDTPAALIDEMRTIAESATFEQP